jgi:CHASE2 domain-containing sensor protein
MSAKPPGAHKGFPRNLVKRLTTGMIVTFVLVGITALFERTYLAHRIETLAYEVLQAPLNSSDTSAPLPIQVVDISAIPGGKDRPTPRKQLEEMINAIAAQHPKAIGVDIDFGPEADGWKVDDDPQFFDFCLSLKQDKQVPVFLAIHSSREQPASGWLGLPKYKELAAAGVVDALDTRRLPRWIQARDVPDRLATMGAALATAYRPMLPNPYEWLRRTVEQTTEGTPGIERIGEDQMRFGLALVNYNKLNQIRNETLSTISATSIAETRDRFTGKMVLLGDATHFEDSFNIPGHQETVPGVDLIACAAYTLAVEPLFEFNTTTRLALDFFFAILLILSVEVVWYLSVRQRPGARFYRRKNVVVLTGSLLVFFLGLFTVAWLHIMWFDFPMVILASLIHPTLEHWLSGLWKKLRFRRYEPDRKSA